MPFRLRPKHRSYGSGSDPNTDPTDRAATPKPVLRIEQRPQNRSYGSSSDPSNSSYISMQLSTYRYIETVKVTTEVNAVMKTCVLQSPSSCSLQTTWPWIWTQRNWTTRPVCDRRRRPTTKTTLPIVRHPFSIHSQLSFLGPDPWIVNRGFWVYVYYTQGVIGIV